MNLLIPDHLNVNSYEQLDYTLSRITLNSYKVGENLILEKHLETPLRRLKYCIKCRCAILTSDSCKNSNLVWVS